MKCKLIMNQINKCKLLMKEDRKNDNNLNKYARDLSR